MAAVDGCGGCCGGGCGGGCGWGCGAERGTRLLLYVSLAHKTVHGRLCGAHRRRFPINQSRTGQCKGAMLQISQSNSRPVCPNSYSCAHCPHGIGATLGPCQLRSPRHSNVPQQGLLSTAETDIQAATMAGLVEGGIKSAVSNIDCMQAATSKSASIRHSAMLQNRRQANWVTEAPHALGATQYSELHSGRYP